MSKSRTATETAHTQTEMASQATERLEITSRAIGELSSPSEASRVGSNLLSLARPGAGERPRPA
jgi:hypothetical protein